MVNGDFWGQGGARIGRERAEQGRRGREETQGSQEKGTDLYSRKEYIGIVNECIDGLCAGRYDLCIAVKTQAASSQYVVNLANVATDLDTYRDSLIHWKFVIMSLYQFCFLTLSFMWIMFITCSCLYKVTMINGFLYYQYVFVLSELYIFFKQLVG